MFSNRSEPDKGHPCTIGLVTQVSEQSGWLPCLNQVVIAGDPIIASQGVHVRTLLSGAYPSSYRRECIMRQFILSFHSCPRQITRGASRFLTRAPYIVNAYLPPILIVPPFFFATQPPRMSFFFYHYYFFCPSLHRWNRQRGAKKSPSPGLRLSSFPISCSKPALLGPDPSYVATEKPGRCFLRSVHLHHRFCYYAEKRRAKNILC